MTGSETTATSEPILLRSERRRRLAMAVLIIAVALLVSFAVVALAGQVFADPMTGT